VLTEKVKSRDPEGSKQAILEAAEKLFSERGFSGVSMRDISDASGVSQSLIHHYFGSKHGLYEEVKKQAIERFWHRWLSRTQKIPQHPHFFAEGVETFFWFVRDNETIMRLSCWACLEGDTDLWPGEVEAIESLSSEIVEAQGKGFLRSDVDATVLTLLVEAASLFWWQYRPNLMKLIERMGRSPEELDRWYLDNVVKILMCGALARTPVDKGEEKEKDGNS